MKVIFFGDYEKPHEIQVHIESPSQQNDWVRKKLGKRLGRPTSRRINFNLRLENPQEWSVERKTELSVPNLYILQ